MAGRVLPSTRFVKLMSRSCIVSRVNGETVLRIGELSKRSGVSPELLRAWERRYGLLNPTRSSGGLRLYSLDDLERVRLMRQHLDGGLAAAEAAALVSRAPVGEKVDAAVAVGTRIRGLRQGLRGERRQQHSRDKRCGSASENGFERGQRREISDPHGRVSLSSAIFARKTHARFESNRVAHYFGHLR